jgi:hypothetical protein
MGRMMRGWPLALGLVLALALQLVGEAPARAAQRSSRGAGKAARAAAAPVRTSPAPPASPAAAADDPLKPDPQVRLLQQIETARQGLLTAQKGLSETVRPAPPPKDPEASWKLVATAAAVAFLGGSLLALFWARRRLVREAPRAQRAEKPVAVPAAPRTAPRAAPRATPASRPPADPMELRLRALEGSVLQILQVVEEVSKTPPAPAMPPMMPAAAPMMPPAAVPVARAAFPSAAGPAPEPIEPAPWLASPPRTAAEAERERPSWDRDISLPESSTVDGRSLNRVRRAVLRLSDEGWDRERIARRLRLGAGDVALILKSAGSGFPAARPAEYARERG